MTQCVLKENSEIVRRRKLNPLEVAELQPLIEVRKRELFDELVKKRWGR